MQISMDKNYKTRAGHPVRIFCIDAALGLPRHQSIVGLIMIEPNREIVGLWLADGRFDVENPHHDFDLKEVTPWDDFKINDPVIAKVNFYPAFKAHFAGVVDGRPMVFHNGCTNWTSDDESMAVDIVRKPMVDEMTFSAVEEETKSVNVEIKFNKEEMLSALTISKLKGITLEQFIVSALEQYLAKEYPHTKGNKS